MSPVFEMLPNRKWYRNWFQSLTGNDAIVAKHDKVRNAKGCKMEGEISKKVRSWKDY